MTTLLTLVYRLRLRLDDSGGDTGTVPAGYTYYWEYDDTGCLWKNTELVTYLTAAQNELALRVPIRDANHDCPDVTQITLVDGQATYDLDTRILAVDQVVLDSTSEPLLKLSDAVKERNYWIDGDTTYSEPSAVEQYREDLDAHKLTVYATPDETDYLWLNVRRLPLEDFAWAQRKSQEPEHAAQWHDALLEWALMQAYLKRDADTFDKSQASYYQGLFGDRVGPRIDFRAQETRKDVAGMRLRTRTYY